VAQEFLDRMQVKNGTLPNGNGLIMVSDDMVISENLFERPLIISQVTYNDADGLGKYSMNANPNNKSLSAELEHVFIERCYILKPITPTHLGLCGAWFLTGVVWWLFAWVFRKNHTIFLQKILLLIPICKFLETMINGLFYNACPWLGA
jgi:hypothetical protein